MSSIIVENAGRKKVFYDETLRALKSSVSCECGQDKLFVNWIDSPFIGGYCKVTCPDCGTDKLLIDDYS